LKITRAEYARRRRQLMRMAGEDAILILPAAPERIRSKDTTYPYRQDSDFWYLTGFTEPEAVLVLVPGRKHGESLLFCRERDADKEAWDGPRAGQEGAVAAYGMDDAYPIADLDEILPGLLEGRSRVYYHFGRDKDFDLSLIGWVNRVRARMRQGAEPPHEFLELGHLLHELRLFKSPAEVKLMQRAADIAVQAQLAAMRATRAGAREFEVEAALQFVYRSNDACAAYEPIVGAGANGCVLHYRANNARCLGRPAAWSTPAPSTPATPPTSPAPGRFRAAIRRSSARCTSACSTRRPRRWRMARPGKPWIAGHEAAVSVLSRPAVARPAQGHAEVEPLASGDYRPLLHAQDRALDRPRRARRRRSTRSPANSASSSRHAFTSSRACTSRRARRACREIPGHRHSHRGRRADHQGTGIATSLPGVPKQIDEVEPSSPEK
jgi:Xaa-Pro aminopeptidase